MNTEQQLEQVTDAIRTYSLKKAPPIFEIFSAIVAMSMSVLLFSLPGVMEQDMTFYRLMLAVLPQYGWAIAYFSGGIVATIGLLFDSVSIRITALCFLVVAFGITAAFYIVTFPNLAGVLMFWITIFSAVSVPMVKYTGLKR